MPTQQAPALGAGLNGAWRRSLLERGDGTVDTDSDVLWLQAGSAFVDLRLPAAMPGPRAVRCLRDADRAQLVALARGGRIRRRAHRERRPLLLAARR